MFFDQGHQALFTEELNPGFQHPKQKRENHGGCGNHQNDGINLHHDCDNAQAGQDMKQHSPHIGNGPVDMVFRFPDSPDETCIKPGVVITAKVHLLRLQKQLAMKRFSQF